MKTPQISVLLCAYNPRTDLLKKAVYSIIEQTFTDWEMFLYDDGSSNDGAEQLKALSETDGRIIYIRNDEHHSLAYGLNVIIEKAHGKYLARMDADDISCPDRFEEQYAFLEEHPGCAYVGSSILLIDEYDRVYGMRKYPKEPGEKDFLSYSPYAHPSLMFRKAALKENGGYMPDEQSLRGEDFELLMRLHAIGEKGSNIEKPLLKYREVTDRGHKHSLSVQLQEVKIRWHGFRKLGLNRAIALPYLLRPLVVWLLPECIVDRVRSRDICEITDNE